MFRHQFDRLHIQLVGVGACRQFFEPLFFAREKEAMFAALLDTQCHLLSVLSMAGSAAEVELSVQGVVREAILMEADAIVLAHNHPSGKFMPSRADQQATRLWAEACEMVGVNLVDHLVFAETGYYSFRERGVLD